MSSVITPKPNEVVASSFYRVEEQARAPADCGCPECLLWTIVYDEAGEPIEIGQAWQGPQGKEAAEDICELMNMAYDAGQENREGEPR